MGDGMNLGLVGGFKDTTSGLSELFDGKERGLYDTGMGLFEMGAGLVEDMPMLDAVGGMAGVAHGLYEMNESTSYDDGTIQDTKRFDGGVGETLFSGAHATLGVLEDVVAGGLAADAGVEGVSAGLATPLTVPAAIAGLGAEGVLGGLDLGLTAAQAVGDLVLPSLGFEDSNQAVGSMVHQGVAGLFDHFAT
jgi:hypothetical protein